MQLQRIGVLGAFLLVPAMGCHRTESGQDGQSGKPTASATAPTDSERIAARAAERWKQVAAAEWIKAYDYLPPQERKTLALVDYLQGKTKHRYENPGVPEILELKGDTAFVAVVNMWTPVHPALAGVKLGPGESLTQRLVTIETWQKVEGEWWYADAKSSDEFFAAHPDVPRPTPQNPSPSDAAPRTPPASGG